MKISDYHRQIRRSWIELARQARQDGAAQPSRVSTSPRCAVLESEPAARTIVFHGLGGAVLARCGWAWPDFVATKMPPSP